MCWDIGKTNVNTTKMYVWDIGKRNVFEAVASGGAGDLLFTINFVEQKHNEVLVYSVVGFVTDLGNKGCGDDLRPRFCVEMCGGHFILRIGCAQLSTCVGDTQQTLKPFFLQ